MEESRRANGRTRMRIGARGGTRTPDAHLRTVALYPLSYTGTSNEDNSEQHPSTAHAAGSGSNPQHRRVVYVHYVRTSTICMLLITTTVSERVGIAQAESGVAAEKSRLPNCRYLRPMVSSTLAGSSAARLARSVRDAEVGGSNPLSPTAPGVAPRRSRFSF